MIYDKVDIIYFFKSIFQEQTLQNSSQSSLQFNRIVLIDRWLDPLSPMLTQLTYAGLLDELFEIGINASLSVRKQFLFFAWEW